jgi:hypothetical protein
VANQGRGFSDEERLVQPLVFPAFAKEFLGFDVGLNLAAERGGEGGTPDFTPADRVTHDFVFEAKGTSEGTALAGHQAQVMGYLSHELTDEVVVTNVVGILVYRLGPGGQLAESLRLDLRQLSALYPEQAAESQNAERFLHFVERFSRRELTTAEKIQRIRAQPDWDEGTTLTDPDWLRARIQSVVDLLRAEVHDAIASGALGDPTLLTDEQRGAVLDELQMLAIRLQIEPEEAARLEIIDFAAATESSGEGKALAQYEAHVAYW